MRLRHPSDIDGDSTLSETLSRMPEQLYRYCGVAGDRRQWLRQLLVESRLYFASVGEFNDPFDSKIPVNFQASRLELDTYWRRVAKEAEPKAPMYQLKPRVRKLVNRALTPQGRQKLSEQMQKSLEKHGTACFAPSATNTLMWAYYAEGHHGVAVRFKMTLANLARLSSNFVPVQMQYRQEVPELNFYGGTTVDFLTTVLGTKSSAWAHEEEWRLVLQASHGLRRIPESMIDAVVFGLKTTAVTRQEVRQWNRGRKQPLELLQVVRTPGSFDLALEREAL
jgi:hypothetical protein